MAEGSMWEAIQHAGWAKQSNLIALIDVNRLGQRGETMLGWDVEGYQRRFEAFGWQALVIDGHDVDAIDEAYRTAESSTDRPTAILARTVKGKGVQAVEDQPGRHGKPLDDAKAAIEELGGERNLSVEVSKPEAGSPHSFDVPGAELPTYEVGEKEATRKAFGAAAAAVGAQRGDVVLLDGEVDNSTGAADFAEQHPDRYFEMYIAEQQLVSAAVGMQVRGWKPVTTSFAAFFSRAYDFVRMAAISRANFAMVGSHAGISIGADGPSQMALEDLASMRAIHSSTVLHPSDANQTVRLTAALVDQPGITFLRTLRGETTIRTPADEDVRIGGSRIVSGADARDVAIVACGVTVDEAADAAERLASEGISARVIDCYSIKPIDVETLAAAARECRSIITVEDHWVDGGLGDAVLAGLAEADALDGVHVRKLAVREMPTSGKPDELLHWAGIDADAIVAAAKELTGARAAA
jgi:transketolase